MSAAIGSADISLEVVGRGGSALSGCGLRVVDWTAARLGLRVAIGQQDTSPWIAIRQQEHSAAGG